MYVLRTLSIHDVVGALKWRQLRLALRISQNLYSNVVSTMRFRLRKRTRLRKKPMEDQCMCDVRSPGADNPCATLLSALGQGRTFRPRDPDRESRRPRCAADRASRPRKRWRWLVVS